MNTKNETNTPLLEIRDLVKTYGEFTAVDRISFSIPAGICFGLLGPNGAGKTTALETIEDIILPTSGNILYKDSLRSESFRKEVGIMFQETALLDFLTVKETLYTFQLLYQKTLPLEKIIDVCNLHDILDNMNNKISGGQKQRLLLALALVNDPDLIFLDEPSTGLDPQARRNMWDIVNDIKSQGKTIILTTHYMEEAEFLCDEIAIMDHGKIIAKGTPDSLIQQYCGNATIVLPKHQFPNPKSLFDDFHETPETIEILTDNVNGCIKHLTDASINLNDLSVRTPNLEDVFLKITGRQLRD